MRLPRLTDPKVTGAQLPTSERNLMHIRTRVFWLPKGGNTRQEYEDACWPEEEIDQQTDSFRCAIADGATETSFSRQWARLMVRAAGTHKPCEAPITDVNSWLTPLRHEWNEKTSYKQLPWYAEEKRRLGAFATLLCLTVTGSDTGRRWESIDVGDSCCFQVRDDQLIAAFPLNDYRQFNTRPTLLSSNRESAQDANPLVTHRAGCWETGDTFYLATDALASWFLRRAEEGAKPWRLLDVLFEPPRMFEPWVRQRRQSGGMRNDDVTLLRVHVAQDA